MFYNQSDIIRQQVVDEIELPIFKSCRIKLHLNPRNSRSPSSLPWNRKPYLSFQVLDFNVLTFINLAVN